eukprot:COSAG04_NODE_2453_length_4093_cov_4.621933_6_plen_133_part_00
MYHVCNKFCVLVAPCISTEVARLGSSMQYAQNTLLRGALNYGSSHPHRVPPPVPSLQAPLLHRGEVLYVGPRPHWPACLSVTRDAWAPRSGGDPQQHCTAVDLSSPAPAWGVASDCGAGRRALAAPADRMTA